VVVAKVNALACALPAKTETPLSRWSCPELVKTDRDALHLVRLLRLDEIRSVRVPGVAEEAARGQTSSSDA